MVVKCSIFQYDSLIVCGIYIKLSRSSTSNISSTSKIYCSVTCHWENRECVYFVIIVRTLSCRWEANSGLVLVIGQVPQKRVSKILRSVCMSLWGNALETIPGMGEGPRIRQREMNQHQVVMEALAEPPGSFDPGMALQSHVIIKQVLLNHCTATSASNWMQVA